MWRVDFGRKGFLWRLEIGLLDLVTPEAHVAQEVILASKSRKSKRRKAGLRLLHMAPTHKGGSCHHSSCADSSKHRAKQVGSSYFFGLHMSSPCLLCPNFHAGIVALRSPTLWHDQLLRVQDPNGNLHGLNVRRPPHLCLQALVVELVVGHGIKLLQKFHRTVALLRSQPARPKGNVRIGLLEKLTPSCFKGNQEETPPHDLRGCALSSSSKRRIRTRDLRPKNFCGHLTETPRDTFIPLHCKWFQAFIPERERERA